MSERQGLSLELFPLPTTGRTTLDTLDTGEKYLFKERQLSNVLFGVQPVAEGPLEAVRTFVGALLLQETGINTGFGWRDWKDHTLEEWLARSPSEWAFGHSLSWEVTIGLSMWVAAYAGAGKEHAIQWSKSFSRRATDEQCAGDFFDMTNDGKDGNVPSLDALVCFFRDTLLNRLLETIPRIARQAQETVPDDVRTKVREWMLPPKSMHRYIFNAAEMADKHLLREIKTIAEETDQITPCLAVAYGISSQTTHLELIDLARLPSYYFAVDYVPPLESTVPVDAVQMFWPSHVQGPTNHIKQPESFGEFMDKYMRRMHLVLVNSYTNGFLIPLVSAAASSYRVYEKEQARKEALLRIRREALDRLGSLIDEIERSSVQRANLKSVLRQWFTDIE
jgi:hypothetical protein